MRCITDKGGKRKSDGDQASGLPVTAKFRPASYLLLSSPLQATVIALIALFNYHLFDAPNTDSRAFDNRGFNEKRVEGKV